LQVTWGSVEDYVAKYDRLPRRTTWGVEGEMARFGTKLARGERYSPFTLLYDHPERFVEYSRAFKGRSQMQWSPGLFKLLLPDRAERSDLQLASTPASDYEPWAALERPQFRAIDHARLHHLVLAAAGRGDRDLFRLLVRRIVARHWWRSVGHDVGG